MNIEQGSQKKFKEANPLAYWGYILPWKDTKKCQPFAQNNMIV